LKVARESKSKHPEIFRLLNTPSIELEAEDLETLAAHVGRLIKLIENGKPTATGQLTQAALMGELGIVKPSNKLKGGDTSNGEKSSEEECYHQFVNDLFSRITGSCGELEKTIFGIRNKVDYRVILADLPLEDEADKPSLMSFKRSLDEVFHGRLAEVLKDVEEAIQRKMAGGQSGRGRKKSSTARIQ
jgi:hypothetical protein